MRIQIRAIVPAAGLRECDPRRLAGFRVIFHLAVLVHFLPSFLFWSESYSPDTFRIDGWNSWLNATLPMLPDGFMHALAAATGVAWVAGLLGFGTRLSSAVAGLGLYAFSSYNDLHTFGVLLIDVWAVFLIWALFEDERLRQFLIAFQFVAGLFFMGFHMVLTEWLWVNPVHIVFNYPPGSLIRDWVAGADWLHSVWVGFALSVLTPLVAMGAPVLIAFRRTRRAGVVLAELFWAGLFSAVRMQPIFYVLYAAGTLLALDDFFPRRRARA